MYSLVAVWIRDVDTSSRNISLKCSVPRPRSKQYCRWKTLFYGSFIFFLVVVVVVVCASVPFFLGFISLLSLFLESFISFSRCLFYMFATVGCSIIFEYVKNIFIFRLHFTTQTAKTCTHTLVWTNIVYILCRKMRVN